MKTETKTLEGWRAMDKYEPDWQSGNWPAWLPKIARAYLRKTNKHAYHPMTNSHVVSDVMYSKEWYGLFDHWGRRGDSKNRTLTTMPYCNCREKAEAFAEALGLDLISPPDIAGSWHPATFLFEFKQKTT